ncbi:paeninodin family lasso peptide [Virgibacillus indicus]|uniref:paeninodin family lasso peptide n=1 Tax=Virgibacillus indicus TaxID=2024554 RepID=UPI000D527DE4|nr:paeninodin family lasso peptide [Virgibacillus indicus]
MKKGWKEPKLELLDIRETMAGKDFWGQDHAWDFDFHGPEDDKDPGNGGSIGS